MLSYLPSILFNLYFANVALAKTHNFNCTLPPDNSHYVGGVEVRSTLSIFWSAVYTVFVCTWAVQHLNIPPVQQRTSDFDWRHFWRFKVPASFWTSLKWMLLTIIMPEYLLGRALSDLVDAYRFKKFTKKKKEGKYHAWTMTHGYYANMGGFILSLQPIPEPEHCNCGGNDIPDSKSKRRFRAVGRNSSVEDGVAHSSASEHKRPPIDPIAINAKQLTVLLKNDMLSEEPPISENEIWDKSKGDVFATISAVVQLIWLVTQLITRKVLNLPSSQLEILALAFAICTIFTWILYFPKPQNILTASNISYDELDWAKYEQNENEKQDQEEPDYNPSGCNSDCPRARSYNFLMKKLKEHVSYRYFKNALLPDDKDPRNPEAFIRNDKTNVNANFHTFNEEKDYMFHLDAETVGFQIGAVVLGACHCLAWNFEFPTHIERLLWRIASVSITGIMPVYYFLWYLLTFWSDKLHPYYEHIKLPLSWLSFTVYIVARLFLLVAPFRELFFLPPRAFIATWSESFPSFS